MSTTTQQTPATNDLRHSILAHDEKGNPIYIKIRLNDECKNGHQDFKITADIYEKGKPKIDKYFICGGSCHDEILAACPDLKLFVDLHLCDYKGIPMHASANGYYFLRNGFNNVKPESTEFPAKFCEYYRLTPAQFELLNTSENETQYAIHIMESGILKQWETQAKEAISKLEEMTGKKFVVDSKETQFYPPTNEQILEEKKRQTSGYYSLSAKEERNKLIVGKLINNLRKEKLSKIEDIQIEYDIKEQILMIGGEKALYNSIYYNHTKEISFNWRGYDKVSDDLLNKIKSEIVLPEGVTIKNNEK